MTYVPIFIICVLNIKKYYINNEKYNININKKYNVNISMIYNTYNIKNYNVHII